MSADDVLPYSEVRRLEVLTGAGRRLQWTAEAKARIAAESYASSVGAVAERYSLRHTQVFIWRQKVRDVRSVVQAGDGDEKGRRTRGDAGIIEVEIGGALVSIPRDANATLAAAVGAALTSIRWSDLLAPSE